MEEKSNGKKLLPVVYVMVIILAGISVAYAALSTTLNVTTNKITQSALSWDVGFVGSTATAVVGGTSSNGRSCGTATITSASVTIGDTQLSKPDDSCTYELTVKNNGTIPALLSSITPTPPNSTTCNPASGPTMVCGNITYKLTSDATGETALPTNTSLGAGSSQTIYLVAKYTGSTVNSSAIVQSGASFSLVYSQN